jgi:hypothetical protein
VTIKPGVSLSVVIQIVVIMNEYCNVVSVILSFVMLGVMIIVVTQSAVIEIFMLGASIVILATQCAVMLSVAMQTFIRSSTKMFRVECNYADYYYPE